MNNQLTTLNYLAQYSWLVGILVIWSLVWKGIALWKAAQQEDKAWFIVLLILNTVGILDIFYIYVFAKRNEKIEPENKHEKKS